MKVAVGSDHLGFHLKREILGFLAEKGVEATDMGCYSEDPVDYPDVAEIVARGVARGEFDRAILICGTGIGMCIAANKIPGVRAALAHDTYSAERARKSNNAQVLTLGAQVIGPQLARMVVHAWLSSEFQGGRSAPKVAKIDDIDARYHKAI